MTRAIHSSWLVLLSFSLLSIFIKCDSHQDKDVLCFNKTRSENHADCDNTPRSMQQHKWAPPPPSPPSSSPLPTQSRRRNQSEHNSSIWRRHLLGSDASLQESLESREEMLMSATREEGDDKNNNSNDEASDEKADQRINTTGEQRRRNRRLPVEMLTRRNKRPLVEAHQHQIYSDVDAVVGREVKLPCFVRPLGPSDSISLVLWYHGDDISGSPFYSVDARYTPLSKAQHFISEAFEARELINFTMSLEMLREYEANGLSSHQTSMASSNINTTHRADKPIGSSTAHLWLKPVVESDAGLYWCRVDYKWERTTISIVTVNVIVPPRSLQIYFKPGTNYCATKRDKEDGGNERRSEHACAIEDGKTVTLNEGQPATLVCRSQGGKPLPILSWYRDRELLRSAIFHRLSAADNRTLTSELHLNNIGPNDHNSQLECLASNDNNRTSLGSRFKLRVNSRASRVEITALGASTSHSSSPFSPPPPPQPSSSSSSSLSALSPSSLSSPATIPLAAVSSGSQLVVICRSYGSRPAANHSWHMAGPNRRQLAVQEHRILIEGSGNNELRVHSMSDAQLDTVSLVTHTKVSFVVQAEDDGHRVSCRAENSLLPSSTAWLEASRVVRVHYAPRATLRQKYDPGRMEGGASSPGSMVEGGRLHLVCNVTSNPKVSSIEWFHNSVRIIVPQSDAKEDDANAKGRVSIVSNETELVITNASHHWEGVFQCVAHNRLGSGYSNQHQVQLFVAPTCATPTQTIPANVGSLVTMICDVDGHPDNVSFHWSSKQHDLRQLLIERQAHGLPWIVNIRALRKLRSRLDIRLESPDQFGQYSCWAENVAGVQKEPCFYNVYENPVKQQLMCDTDFSEPGAIHVACNTTNASASLGSGSLATTRLAFNVSHSTSSTLYNLKVLKNKRQLYNTSSVQANFQIDVGQLRQAEKALARNESDNMDSNYMMLISALVDNRLISDINLSFKLGPETDSHGSRASNASHYTPQQQHEPGQVFKKESKRTNAASFQTGSTISRLPLIWNTFLSVVVLLILLIFIVSLRVYLHKHKSNKEAAKPHVRFDLQKNSENHDDPQASSAREYLVEDNGRITLLASSSSSSTSGAMPTKESIQLFTLTNFDPIDGFYGQNNGDNLPDLMRDTIGDAGGQHHNVCIINNDDKDAHGDGGMSVHLYDQNHLAALCGAFTESSDRSFSLSPSQGYNAYGGHKLASTFFARTATPTTSTAHIWLPGGSMSTGEASSVHTTTDETNESQSTFLIEDNPTTTTTALHVLETSFP